MMPLAQFDTASWLQPQFLNGGWAIGAPAKINLDLRVVGRRDDGYHLIESVIAFATIGDRLTASRAETVSLAVEGPFASDTPSGPDNLVLRAANALGASAVAPGLGARLTLDKQLPVAAGIGGGSADAAGCLKLLCRLWDIDPDDARLPPLAAALGADVPACLAGHTLIATGIGEKLAPLPGLGGMPLVLVHPAIAVPTAAVFHRYAAQGDDFTKPTSGGDFDPTDPIPGLAASGNDLTAPALELAPGIGAVIDALSQAPGCRLARMSGSGATCFALMEDAASAVNCAQALSHRGWWTAAAALL